MDRTASPLPYAILLVLATSTLLTPVPSAQAFLRCTLYAWRAEVPHYQTTYRYSAEQTAAARARYRPLPKKGVYAIARLYKLSAASDETRPCTNLPIVKRLFLQRKDDPAFVFTEVNEFYASDGTLITTNTQDLTAQLTRSGYYIASNPLPIPQGAPPGRYKMVSKLLLTKKGRKRVFLLASSTIEYEIKR